MIIDFAWNRTCSGGWGHLHLGAEAERRLGRRQFSELLSVVTSQPMFQVRFGRLEIGFVHPLHCAVSKERSRDSRFGRSQLALLHVDWTRKVAHVEPTKNPEDPLAGIECPAIPGAL